MGAPKTNRTEKISLAISKETKETLHQLAQENTRSISQQIEHMMRVFREKGEL